MRGLQRSRECGANMFATLYCKVLELSQHCNFDDVMTLARLANLYRKANDIASAPSVDMPYEVRCMRTANLENVLADIQDIMHITPSANRRRIATMYENVAVAMKKSKSLELDTVPWNDAFVEALKASREVALFEGDLERAAEYLRVLPFYESMRGLADELGSVDVNSADWHDVMTCMNLEKIKLALATGKREHIDTFDARAILHRDAAVAIRLNESLPVGSLAWFANAERLHHAVHRLEADPDSIASG